MIHRFFNVLAVMYLLLSYWEVFRFITMDYEPEDLSLPVRESTAHSDFYHLSCLLTQKKSDSILGRPAFCVLSRDIIPFYELAACH